MLEVLEVKLLGLDKGEDPAGCAHHNVRAVGLDDRLVLADRQPAEEHANLPDTHISKRLLRSDFINELRSIRIRIQVFDDTNERKNVFARKNLIRDFQTQVKTIRPSAK